MYLNRVLALVLALGALPFALVSCGSDNGSGPDTLTVAITPGTAELATGSNTTLTARVTDGSGATVPGQTFTWSSSNDAVATVSATGTVEGLTPGQVTITATTTINGAAEAATAVITVIQVATTVDVTPATGSVVVGETLQFTAAVLDGVGAAIPGATITWSSSDAAVMSVDVNGLATGVAEGMATISATVGAASGTASTEVRPGIGPLEPTQDITLSGNVDVTTFTVPVGVTVTLDADLTLTATETVNIAGALAGNCVGVNLQAVGLITVDGSITTPCAGMAMPPGISILSGSGFTLQDAVITTSGPVSLVSDISAATATAFAPAASASVPVPCFINSTTIDLAPAEDGADGQPDGEDGYDGNDIEVSCGRDRAVLSGSILRAADGGVGGEGFSSDETMAGNGGRGGQGGGVSIKSEVGISFTNTKSIIEAGNGGSGGPGEAQSKNAVAVGGDGGHAGKILIEVAANGSEIFAEDIGFIDITAGSGGIGGTAAATGDLGADATDTQPAEDGGNASATGGTGGDNYPEENKAVLGDLVPRGLVAGLLSVDFLGGASGAGGMAFAQGGEGGAGNMLFPKGGDGGTMAATGGAGGKLTVLRNGNQDTYPGTPGNGGRAEYSEGEGGSGFNDCLVGDIQPGGNGGKGGDASGGDGAPGRGFDGSNKGSSNGVFLAGSIGSGGDGGDGVMPGSLGAAGMDGIVAMGMRDQDGVPFEDGIDGNPCDKGPLDTAISLMSDPDGHEDYIALLGLGNLTLVQLPNGDVKITGSPPWVNMTGTIIFVAALNAWEIIVTGTGNVMGPASYNFTGTATVGGNGRVTGFTGTVTVDTTGLPGTGSTTYSLTATMPMASE
ncbi:MAG: hypothetical protein BMS9Abin29_2209 [Gemmatimonadota bacterium]|nr:MAG: hypothetical protein BMS9Abin29_2209 [Gemmatimonadota bacterium]